MKPQQLARLLNVSPATLRHWAGKEFGEFLSPNAAGINGAKRSFSEQDARILAWCAQMKAQNMPLVEIIATLKVASAENWRNLPPLPGGMAGDEPIAVVPREAVEERIKALEDRTRLQIVALERERDELRAQNAEFRQENAELRRQMYTLNERILQLTERLASLLENEQKLRK
jgi:DNA-binding transcriptional MerR regulator